MSNVHINNFENGHIHFIGIGGISMSGLAEILLTKGYTVSGSDMQDSPILHKLSKDGAHIYIGHDKSHIAGADLVVYTAAVHDDNPEIIEAKLQNIPLMDRATLLGQIMQSFRFSIGVAGTHGKTTTTSMLSIIMQDAKLDPTILVGGELDAIGGNVRTGNSSYFITEACEYVESFLKFYPYMGLILNIDQDHLDYFRDLDHIYSAFFKFAKLIPSSGYLIGCNDDPRVSKLLTEMDCNTITYGIDNASNWMASNIQYDKQGHPSFNASYNGQDMGRFNLNVPGSHNVYNALAACAAAYAMGISPDISREALKLYTGTHRRFETKGEVGGITVIDDYAHHPTEISATLSTIEKIPHGDVWYIFQPHTYTRTKKLFDRFIDTLKGVDNLIITDIYAAREQDTGEIHSKDLVEAINKNGGHAIYISSFSDIEDYVKSHAKAGDMVITIGAGSVYKIGEEILNK